MDIYEQLETMKRVLQEFKHQQEIIKSLPMETIRTHQRILRETKIPSISEIANQYKDIQKYNQNIHALSDFKEQQEQIKEMLNSPMFEWIKNINSMQYPEVLKNAMITRLGNLPENYIITTEEENGEEYVIKDVDTDENIPFPDLTGTLGVLDIFTSISEDEIFSFYNYLCKYPMLGLNHEIGKKILDQVDNADLSVKSNFTVFRARKREKGQERPWSEPEMFGPPYGVSTHGRYNTIGTNVLYTCDNLDGAFYEVRPERNNVIDAVEWTVKENIKMLDLSELECPMMDYCRFSSNSDFTLKPEYLIPNFVAQCCDLKDIDGLIYRSNIVENTINHVFFAPNKRWFELISKHTKTVEGD